MTKRTVEEIQKEIRETYEEALYYSKISRGVFYAIKDWEPQSEPADFFAE